MSVLAWVIKVLNKLNDLYKLVQQNELNRKLDQVNLNDHLNLIQKDLDDRLDIMQADIDNIKKVIGVGVPVQETIEWDTPKP